MTKAMQAMIATAATMNAAQLMEQARLMAVNTAGYADDVLMALLGALEGKIPEAEYIAFCNELI